ncbi:MAG: hypothetical protein M1833_000219 [Piccolia ochrophora]|nr:MAG: hypothetical protein M1833_000219 [Piccolia ochrophora]
MSSLSVPSPVFIDLTADGDNDEVTVTSPLPRPFLTPPSYHGLRGVPVTTQNGAWVRASGPGDARQPTVSLHPRVAQVVQKAEELSEYLGKAGRDPVETKRASSAPRTEERRSLRNGKTPSDGNADSRVGLRAALKAALDTHRQELPLEELQDIGYKALLKLRAVLDSPKTKHRLSLALKDEQECQRTTRQLVDSLVAKRKRAAKGATLSVDRSGSGSATSEEGRTSTHSKSSQTSIDDLRPIDDEPVLKLTDLGAREQRRPPKRRHDENATETPIYPQTTRTQRAEANDHASSNQSPSGEQSRKRQAMGASSPDQDRSSKRTRLLSKKELRAQNTHQHIANIPLKTGHCGEETKTHPPRESPPLSQTIQAQDNGTTSGSEDEYGARPGETVRINQLQNRSAQSGPRGRRGISQKTVARSGGDQETAAIARRSLRRFKAQRQLGPTARTAMDEYRIAMLGSLGNGFARPYLAKHEREAFRKGMTSGQWSPIQLARWEGQVIHVDFSLPEMLALIPSINMIIRPSDPISTHSRSSSPGGAHFIARRLHECLSGASETQFSKIVRHARRQKAPTLRCLRDNDQDLLAFLRDASRECLSENPSSLRVGPLIAPRLLHYRPPDYPAIPPKRRLLLGELGVGHTKHGRSSTKAVLEQRKTELYDSLRLWRSWPPGGSSDVMCLAWAPDGDAFTAGCAALTDDQNMQYNRGNNLLLGSLAENCLKELPDHHVPRHRPESGPNSTEEMFNALDPRLYQTITEVKFDPSGRQMYSASYDKTVKIWDTAMGSLLGSLQHEATVDVLATSSAHGVFATGSQVIDDAVRVYSLDANEPSSSTFVSFTSSRAKKLTKEAMYPSCLQWGIHPAVQHLLLTGFTPSADPDETLHRIGDLCCWDVNTGKQIKVYPAAQNTFDCAWHPTRPSFATAVGADSSANRGMRSYVRIYEPSSMTAFSRNVDLECPALDINTITWCVDDAYCTASCTDGATYVWDRRVPHTILHTLRHGQPIQQLPAFDDPSWRPREKADTGVRFAQWGDGSNRLYTGSSDGVVKAWDIRRAAEDTWVRDVVELDAGIMCGAFSPDFSKLLLGDAAGGVNVLAVGLDEEDEDDRVQNLTYEPAGPATGVVATHAELVVEREMPVASVVSDAVGRASKQDGEDGDDDSTVHADYDFDCGLISSDLTAEEWEEIEAGRRKKHD